MLDYALFVGDPKEPSSNSNRLDHEIAKKITDSSDSINHTPYVALRHRPIFLGIETKTITRTEQEARVQLGIWVASHIRRIWSLGKDIPGPNSRLLKNTIEEMVFPLIYVQSAKWFLMLARASINLGAEEGREVEVFVYHDITLGETSSIKGIYQLLKALQLLGNWGNVVFRSWWKTILGIVAS
jgi:hypothetical protein